MRPGAKTAPVTPKGHATRQTKDAHHDKRHQRHRRKGELTMPFYRVRLTKEVSDTLDAYIVVEAATPDEAGELALAKAAVPNPAEPIDWALAYEGEGDPPEIDSVTECEKPQPG